VCVCLRFVCVSGLCVSLVCVSQVCVCLRSVCVSGLCVSQDGDLECTLERLRASGEAVCESQVSEWLVQLLLGLDYMHQRRILHRDLKTKNVFLKKNMVKIGDLGVSCLLMGSCDLATTLTGTPYYMSPEALGHQGYDSKSDVWCHPEESRWLQTRQTSVLNGAKGAEPIELTPYYKSMLHTWRTVIRTERDMDNLEQWTPEEPLFFNPCMQSRLLSSVSIRKCLLGNGITKPGHLLNEEVWIPTEELKAVTGLRSSRLAAKLQEELCNTLPSSYRTYIGQRHGTTQDRKSDEFPGL
ncbi:hypothetical protein QTP86_016835, partial [Hemibagrus guttatus]